MFTFFFHFHYFPDFLVQGDDNKGQTDQKKQRSRLHSISNPRRRTKMRVRNKLQRSKLPDLYGHLTAPKSFLFLCLDVRQDTQVEHCERQRKDRRVHTEKSKRWLHVDSTTHSTLFRTTQTSRSATSAERRAILVISALWICSENASHLPRKFGNEKRRFSSPFEPLTRLHIIWF